MRTRRWHSYAVTVAVLILQVSVSALGTIGMCVDRPHTHGGVPALDCLMHESQPAGTPPEASASRPSSSTRQQHLDEHRSRRL